MLVSCNGASELWKDGLLGNISEREKEAGELIQVQDNKTMITEENISYLGNNGIVIIELFLQKNTIQWNYRDHGRMRPFPILPTIWHLQDYF